MKRLKLLLLLASMPDEAFGWLVVSCLTRIWPDGLGGFQPESRESIAAVRAEAQAYTTSQ